MKVLTFTLLSILILTSCEPDGNSGGNGNGQGNGQGTPSQVSRGLTCLENKLNWVETPPDNKTDFFRTLEKNYETCEVDELVMKKYLNKVLKRHPQFFIW